MKAQVMIAAMSAVGFWWFVAGAAVHFLVGPPFGTLAAYGKGFALVTLMAVCIVGLIAGMAFISMQWVGKS